MTQHPVLVWSEIPDLQSIAGIVIIVATGLYTLHRELANKENAHD